MTALPPRDNKEEPESREHPFIVRHEHIDTELSGGFRPNAFVTITPALRTSGLLAALHQEDLKSLLFVLTFVTANGWIRPSVEQLAEAMRVSRAKASHRMARLSAFSWRGEPVVQAVTHESGMQIFSPGRTIIGSEDAPTPPSVTLEPPIPVASRDEVIAYSRARYARPRADVEREIALQNGWPMPEEMEALADAARQAVMSQRAADLADPELAAVRRRLMHTGVSEDQTDRLLMAYGVERAKQQLDWLPYRNAKSPARFLVAAIENGYAEPLPLRLQQSTATEQPKADGDFPPLAIP